MVEIKIKFLETVELEVITGIDDIGNPEYETEEFQGGDVYDVLVLEDHLKTMDIQLGNGGVLMMLVKNLVEIVKE